MLILLAFVSMFAKDLLYTAVTTFISKGKPLAASIFDILGDIAAILTYGVSGAVILKHGVSMTTFYVLVAVSLGSLLGTLVGYLLARDIDKRM